MFEFAKVYIRSITGIMATSAVVAYLGLSDPNIVIAYLGAVCAMVMLDKNPEV